ncbi:hypothetical protein [Streptomyces sp. NPDC017230]|uniref:hypothetical protein n=1 Tax=unclassified Streptomyces TaxID=2593676 RepID=UPI003791C3CD
MTAYLMGEHVSGSINVHIVPRLGSRKLISVTPIVVERFLDELEADGVGPGEPGQSCARSRKHRKVEEFREVPLPRSVREAIERYEEKHGTTKEGYLLRGPSGYCTEPMERRRVRTLFEKLPAVDGMGMYGFRHCFASNALGSGIPITDVAEWMGAQVDRGDVPHVSTLDAGEYHQGGARPGCRPVGRGLRPQRSLSGAAL